jgi:hypothetical protein
MHKRSGAQIRIGERIALRAPLTLLSFWREFGTAR